MAESSRGCRDEGQHQRFLAARRAGFFLEPLAKPTCRRGRCLSGRRRSPPGHRLRWPAGNRGMGCRGSGTHWLAGTEGPGSVGVVMVGGWEGGWEGGGALITGLRPGANRTAHPECSSCPAAAHPPCGTPGLPRVPCRPSTPGTCRRTRHPTRRPSAPGGTPAAGPGVQVLLTIMRSEGAGVAWALV